MRILHTVESYSPAIGGMQEVVKQLSERLVKLGHEVTVATSKSAERTAVTLNGVKIKEFDITGNTVRGMSGEVDAYRKFVLESDFDVVTNFAAQQWATDALLPILDQLKMKKIFVPTGFSGLYLPEYEGYFQSMRSWIKKYDANVFLSDDYRDINFAREHGVGKNILIPNGAAADEFAVPSVIDIRAQLGIPANHFLILHVGSHTGVKGHNEAMRIFHRARIKDATFLLVANNVDGGCSKKCKNLNIILSLLPQRLFDRKKIIITALSRAETVAAYQTADLFLFPSAIECSPIVLFECMASRTPFLTTDVGNSLEIIKWSRAGLALPTITLKEKHHAGNCKADIKSSAQILENIYNQPEMRKTMGDYGHSVWTERFTWEKIACEYERLYGDLLTN